MVITEKATAIEAQPNRLPDHDPFRVLIADDAISIRRFLRTVLEHTRQFDVIGETSDGDETVEMARTLQPDIVLLDLGMPLAYGTSTLRRVCLVAPTATVIVVSALDPALEAPVLEAGAAGFVPKGFAPLDFLERLGKILGRSLKVVNRTEWKNISANHRAVVFGDEPGVRHLVSRVLDSCGAIVIAETGNASTMLETVGREKPGIVVIGLSAKGAHNIALVSELRRRSPASAIAVYSPREKWQNKTLATGVTAFVLRPRIQQFVQQIERLTPSP